MPREVEFIRRSCGKEHADHHEILEGDGTPVDVTGYSISYYKTALIYTGFVLTVGLLRLVFHWFPHWMLKSTHKVCPLSEAQKVLIRDSSGVYFIHKVVISSDNLDRPPHISDSTICNSPNGYKRSNEPQEEDEAAYFLHKELKYIWSRSSDQFELLRAWEEKPYSELFPAKPLPEDIVVRRRTLYGPNEIIIRLTPIAKMLLNECLNPFYCFQAFSCALWFSDEYWMYASCILVISAISLTTQLYEMRKNQRALKQTVCDSAVVSVCREVNGLTEFLEVDSTELVPGDILEIPRKGCTMHCDALLLSGNCIVNESTLTGESVPVTKTPLPQRNESDEVVNIRSAARHVLFGGTCVIQTRNYADERVLALVARTGFRTAKGELVRSILFPKPLKFKFTQDAMKFVAALATVALIGFCVSIYLMHRTGVDVKSICLRALDLITVAVPPALPMAMTVGVVFAQRRLRNQDIYCINPSVINVCGVINVTCFDKTGTLTEDGLDLWGVIPTADGRFGEPHFEPSEFERGPLLESMATCHSLTRIEGVLSGDPLDLKMFQSTKWDFIEDTEDHCKFEMAVPAIVRPYDKNSLNDIALHSKCESDRLPYEVGILRQFPFTSSLQRMSVIARVLDSSHFSIYTKGAPETIESLCRRDTIPSDFHSVLLEYTREGYRVLALAWRPLKVSYTRVLKIHRERVEQDLLFLGLLVMENRLKPETAPVIQILRNANIRPIMVTGDNMLTAVSVARDCEMIDEFDRIVIVSAKPPPIPCTVDPTVATASGDMNGVSRDTVDCSHVAFVSRPTVTGSAPSGPSMPTFFGSLLGRQQQSTPLVEFHYAEDLHKPVTEVTATNGGAGAAGRNWHIHHRRATAGVLSGLRGEKSHERRWFRRRSDRSVRTSSSHGTVPTAHKEVVTSQEQMNGQSLHPDDVLFDPFTPSPTSISAQPPPRPAATAPHRINIRMIDRPDFHLAISGKTWAIIREHYPWLIPKLVVKGTVFARFSPDQKAQLIEALQSVGYFVAMCGDGANDCGALKAAHAGIALSEAEASVASPFTTKRQNVSCVPTLIREGRCALVTSFGTLKFITGYSLVQFFSVIALYYIGSNISDGQFLYIDLFLITSLSVTFGYTKAYTHLSVEPPAMRLLSLVTLMSLGSQLLTHLAAQLIAFITVRLQPWYLPLFELHEDYELANYETTALFSVSAYQYLILAVVFSKGAPYRRTILSNYLFIVNLAICLICTIFLTSYPFNWMLNLFELVRIPAARYVILLHAVVLANFLICYLLEWLIDGVSFRRRLLHIRRALFPRHVQRKDYERIRDEIDKMAGTWPPLIRSASVQALPKELFNDSEVAPPGAKPTRPRRRNVSGMSTETEDEELLSSPHVTHPVLITAPGAQQHASHAVVQPNGIVVTPKTSVPSSVSVKMQHGLRRCHSFAAGESDLSHRRCLPVADSSHEDHSGDGSGPNVPSNFVDMPESMFHMHPQVPLPKRNNHRKRYQSSGPRSEPLYAQMGDQMAPDITRNPFTGSGC